MIGFFRRVRKKLADDNQFLKYSRYAVGEIVLVVIGILIALNINNWNEEQKIRYLEGTLLTELYESIKNDTIRLNGEMNNFRRIQNHGRLLRSTIDSGKPYHKGLDSSFAIINTFVIQEADYLIFERIEDVGIEIIKNDELRKAIKRYYELSKHVADVENGEIGDIFMQKIYPKFFKAFSYNNYAVPMDFDALKNESEFLIQLDYCINDSRYYINRGKRRKESAIRLLALLKHEIKLHK